MDRQDLIRDKIIKDGLKKQGINPHNFDIFKLYNPNTYDKLITQYKIAKSQGIKSFKDTLQNYRAIKW
jgi:hypothetical protein